MPRLHATLSGSLASLLLAALVACGTTSQVTTKPLVSDTPTAGPTTNATPTTARPGHGGPPASPLLPIPTGTIQPPFGSGSPIVPLPSRSPLTTLSAGAVAPTSDGNCPATHPIKAAQLGPLKTYFLADNAAYSRTQAGECFANEADAEAAGYRKAAR